MTKALLSILLVISAGAPGDEVLIPAELIHQLFQTEEPNQSIPKRLFNLSELETLLSDPRFKKPDRARDLTRRYLAITYPAGLTHAADLARSDLDPTILEQLLTAPPGSVRFAMPRDLEEALDLLGQLPPKSAEALLAGKSDLVVHQLEKLDIASLLKISDERFQKIVPFYGSTVPIHDAQRDRYLLSTPAREHCLARLLEGSKANGVECSATLEVCEDETCRSSRSGNSYASFKFEEQHHWYLRPADGFTATCLYANTFRREYTDRLEIEYAFEGCRLLTVNGEEPAMDPLLQDLSKVQ